MRVTRRQLRRILQEAVTLDIEKGDVILTGKFKNKRTVVKDFGTDDLGQPTINGMKLLKFRIEKLMSQDKWSKKSQEEADLEEGKTMRVTRRQLRSIIREVEQRSTPPGDGFGDNDDGYPPERPFPSGPPEPEYGEFARSPEVQQMLMDAGFNADGSFGADGYPGPSNWQLFSPENIEDAGLWIEAAISMNEALRKAERDLEAGVYQYAQDAWSKIIYPVQQSFASTGAADTEGHEVAGDWLEKAGWEW